MEDHWQPGPRPASRTNGSDARSAGAAPPSLPARRATHIGARRRCRSQPRFACRGPEMELARSGRSRWRHAPAAWPLTCLLLMSGAHGGVGPGAVPQRPVRAAAAAVPRPPAVGAAAGVPRAAVGGVPVEERGLLARCREHVRVGDALSALSDFQLALAHERPTVRACNQLLLLMADSGQLSAAVDGYRAMLAAGSPAPTAVTYSTLISRAARAHDRALAEGLFAEMLELGCQPDTQVCQRVRRHPLPPFVQARGRALRCSRRLTWPRLSQTRATSKTRLARILRRVAPRSAARSLAVPACHLPRAAPKQCPPPVPRLPGHRPAF